jgi:outer membrane lipoprotein carrier protein
VRHPFSAAWVSALGLSARGLSALALLLTLFVTAQPHAQADDFECKGDSKTNRTEVLSKIETRYRTIRAIKSDFTQNSFFIGLDREEASEGRLFFEKPGKMNWTYETPKKQQFVSDGKTVSFYQPSLKQVTLTDFENSFHSDLPVTFLLGIGSLSEAFTLKKVCRSEKALLVELAPKKPDSNMVSFSLLVDEETFTPVGAKTRDVGGNETAITLRGSEINPTIPAERFVIDLPKGIDVIDQRKTLRRGELSETPLTPSEQKK